MYKFFNVPKKVLSHTSIYCLAEYSNDTVVTLKLVGEEKIIVEN